MIDRSADLLLQMQDVAEQAILKYARGILTVEELKAQLWCEWQKRNIEEVRLRKSILTRLAQALCSRALCIAWRSKQPEIRNRAFENMRCYLDYSLRHSKYAVPLGQHPEAIDDILNQTLLEFCVSQERNPLAGPRDPTTFLKWIQVAAFRKAVDFIQGQKGSGESSLEEKREEYEEQFIDERNPNPEKEVISLQLQQAIKDVILSLRNPLYRQVLLYTYLGGVEEKELAERSGLSLQEIYLCRFRALRALKKHPDIQRIMRIWRGEE
jgi:DNA-directed RNA polymerase specialized sigma24 family protein